MTKKKIKELCINLKVTANFSAGVIGFLTALLGFTVNSFSTNDNKNSNCLLLTRKNSRNLISLFFKCRLTNISKNPSLERFLNILSVGLFFVDSSSEKIMSSFSSSNRRAIMLLLIITDSVSN